MSRSGAPFGRARRGRRADDADLPGVEFLDLVEPSDPADDELAGPPAGAATLRRLVVGGAVAVVVGGALAARLAESSRSQDAAAARPSPPALVAVVPATGSVAPLPVQTWPVPSAQVPSNVPTLIPMPPGVSCPYDATCSLWEAAPQATLDALRAQFPHAGLRAVVTQLANRTGHFEPDLLAREVVARAGRWTVTVDVRKAVAAQQLGDRTVVHGGAVRVVAEVPGYSVSVQVSGPGAPGERARRLAEDARLLLPD